MSLFFRPGRPEERSVSRADVWGAGGDLGSPLDHGGIQSALTLIPVYSAVSLIVDMVSTATLRGSLMKPDGSWTPMNPQPQLVRKPGPYGSLIDWLHQCLASLLLRGNAIGYVTSLDEHGRPAQIIWLHPDEVTIYENTGDWFHRPTYYWRGRKLDNSLVVHIAAFTLPGSVKGLSPLALFKLQIETGLRAQQFGDDWFKNGATPSGILKNSEQELQPGVAGAMKRRFKASVRNRDPFVTGSDWDYKTLAVAANESQFLETIKANATQIAAIYRVAPEDIGGETGRTMTYKTLESDNAKLTGRTLRVWAKRIDTILTDLLPADDEHIAFDLAELSRGDQTSQAAVDAAELNAGITTNDEVRARRGLPPLTDDQVAAWQENYRKSAPAVEPPKPPTEPSAPVPGGPE